MSRYCNNLSSICSFHAQLGIGNNHSFLEAWRPTHLDWEKTSAKAIGNFL
jgi:hypothetical protein